MPRTHISELVLFQEAMLLRPHLRMRVVSDGLDRAPVNISAYTDQRPRHFQTTHILTSPPHTHRVAAIFLEGAISSPNFARPHMSRCRFHMTNSQLGHLFGPTYTVPVLFGQVAYHPFPCRCR